MSSCFATKSLAACLPTLLASSAGSLATPRGGADATDYTLSATASSFVPFYAQRISSNIVMHSARNALEHVKRLRRDPLRATA